LVRRLEGNSSFPNPPSIQYGRVDGAAADQCLLLLEVVVVDGRRRSRWCGSEKSLLVW